jgi:sialidase-1
MMTIHLCLSATVLSRAWMTLHARCDWLVAAALACQLASSATTGAEPRFEHQDLFVSGQGGYHTYRIPAMVVSRQGTLLAFCEGRKSSAADHGDIDLLLRRSFDNGKTWRPMQRVHEEGGDQPITIGNPCPIAAADGTIHLLFSRNNARAFCLRSRDEGQSFSTPIEITDSLRGFDFTWNRLGTGPVHGIQTRHGRLIAPVWLNFKIGSGYRSAAALSDDDGRTWKPGGVVPPAVDDCNEGTLAELADGRLVFNLRNRQAKCRAVAVSSDGGQNWNAPQLVADLVDPQCQASLLNVTPEAGRVFWLFCNPAAIQRRQLTLKLTYDDGGHWTVAQNLFAGPAAYSDLALTKDGLELCCLFECGERSPYERIRFTRIDCRPWSVGAAP